jgi:lactoylglutathione lyase
VAGDCVKKAAERERLAMEPLAIKTHGIILFTEKFEDCVRFYRDVIGLPVWFVKQDLVCFRFGNGYLMVETGGRAVQGTKENSQNPTMLRFNVADVEAASATLRARGIAVDVQQFSWGMVGTFADPDGNKCEFKNADDPFFV